LRERESSTSRRDEPTETRHMPGIVTPKVTGTASGKSGLNRQRGVYPRP